MPSAGEEGPILRNAKLADLDLSMVLPWYAGANSLNFYMIVVDHDWRDVERFVLRFTYLDGEVHKGHDLTELQVGHFPLGRLDLPYAGRWRADVVVRRAEMRENRFSYEFVLSHL